MDSDFNFKGHNKSIAAFSRLNTIRTIQDTLSKPDLDTPIYLQ